MIDTEPIRNNLVFCHMLQMIFAAIYISSFAYAVANPGWWDGLFVTHAFGLTTGGVTFLSLCPWAWALMRHHPLGIAFGHPLRVWTLWIGVMLRELLLLAAWFTTLVLMSLPKHKDFRNMFTVPAYGAWNVGIVVACIEILCYGCSFYYVVKLCQAAAPRIMRFEAI